MERTLDQGIRATSGTSSNTSSSISSEFEDKTESIHIKALGQLTKKIDQILFKIQSIINIRATSVESESNINQASDKSTSIRVEEVYSKGSIFDKLENIDNEIGNAHFEMKDLLEELKKSKPVLKCERFVAKKEVVQIKSNKCKRETIRNIVKCSTKCHVFIYRQSRRLKYRKTNKKARNLLNRILDVVSKKPLLRQIILSGNKSKELEYDFKKFSIEDRHIESEKLPDMPLLNSDDDDIIVLYRRPTNNNMFNDDLPSKDVQFNTAKNQCPHDKELYSAQSKRNVSLKREIGTKITTVSDPIIGNNSHGEGLMPKICHEKRFNQFKMSAHRLSRPIQQKHRKAANSYRLLGGKIKKSQNNEFLQKKSCASATQTDQSDTVKQTLAKEVFFMKDLNRKSKVVDLNINQTSSSTLGRQLQIADSEPQYSKRVEKTSEANLKPAEFIRETAIMNILHKRKTAESAIEVLPFNRNEDTKHYSGFKTDIKFHLMDMFPINIKDKRYLKQKYEEQLLKYTFRCMDLKSKSKLSRCVVKSIKLSSKHICKKSQKTVTRYISRILENTSLTYISPRLIFKYSNIIHTKEMHIKQNLEYCKVFGKRNFSHRNIIHKQLKNGTKVNNYQRNKLNRIIDNSSKYISEENQFKANSVFNEGHSTKAGINFDSYRAKVTQHIKHIEPLKNDNNIANDDNTFKQISNPVRKVDILKRLMNRGFKKTFNNHKIHSKRMSQFILKYNLNLKAIVNRFNMLNFGMKAISEKQTEIEEFMKTYITRSKVKNRMRKYTFKNFSKKIRRLEDIIRLEKIFPKERFENTINEQNDKVTHFQSELHKLNKITKKIEEHLTVYMKAIKILKECTNFNSNKIESVHSSTNFNAYQQHLISNKLNDIEAYINNIDIAVQTSIASLEEDIYTNRYLIETGAKIIEDKVNRQDEINDELDEQLEKQDDEIGIILTCILDLKKQLDGRREEQERAQSITKELEERNPLEHNLLEYVKENISMQLRFNQDFDTILQKHERKLSHFEKVMNLNFKAQKEINNCVIESLDSLEKETHCLKACILSTNSTFRNRIGSCCKEIKYLKKIIIKLLQMQNRTSDDTSEHQTNIRWTSSPIYRSQKKIVIEKKRFRRQLSTFASTETRKFIKIVIVLLSICLTSFVVVISLTFDLGNHLFERIIVVPTNATKIKINQYA